MIDMAAISTITFTLTTVIWVVVFQSISEQYKGESRYE